MSPKVFITKGVPKLAKQEDISVCLPPGFKRCYLSVTREDVTQLLPISQMVAAELIASKIAYQG